MALTGSLLAGRRIEIPAVKPTFGDAKLRVCCEGEASGRT
jgi:hypothetical protein